MKKILLLTMSLVMAIGTSAQSKKELQEKVSQLETRNIELNALLSDKTSQVEKLTLQVASLKQTVSQLQATNTQLQGQIAQLQTNVRQKEEPQFLSDSIAEMLLKFYSATTVEERAKYVMDPQRVLPLMRNYYKGGIKPLDKFYYVYGEENKFSKKEEGAVKMGPNLYFLKVELVQDKLVNHVVIRTPQGLKLDWEATVQYGENSNYMLTAANVGKTFTFHCQIFNVINDWNDSYDYIELSNGLGDFINRYNESYPDKSYGIFLKNGAVGKTLRNMFTNKVPDLGDEFYNCIVKAQVFQNTDGNYYLEIKEIVSETSSRFVPIRPKKEQVRF